VLADVAEELRDRLDPPIRRVWDDELAALRSDLFAWLRSMAAQSPSWQPLHSELGFGMPPGEGRDPQSTRDAVVLPHGALLRGCVDLIERGRERDELRITDYKTGNVDTKDGLIIAGGERLQPVLYGLAVEAALGTPVGESRLFYCTTRGGFSERVVPLTAGEALPGSPRAAGALVLKVIDDAIAGGFLPPAPRKEACGRCDYRSVCGPYEEERAQRKDQDPLGPLLNLRGMP
jgi:CRISPR/Cas system-associated exonuclease Cas4 (RecB family)